jgi:phage shock protein E
MDPYEKRALEYGLAHADDVRKALSNPETIVLDVRTEEEINSTGKLEHPKFRRLEGTKDSCPDFEDDDRRRSIVGGSVVGSGSDNNATVLLYCRSGRRAATAANVLKSKGYSGSILNAGGLDDLRSFGLLK